VTGDWTQWHDQYDVPGSSLSQRLSVVQDYLRRALIETSASAPGQRRLISMCAGEGRDVLPVLADQDEPDQTRALLVELNPQLAERARTTAADLGLANVDVTTADAGITDPYLNFAPAHIVLACGVFGNISSDHIRQTIATLPSLLTDHGIVIWTRGRNDDDTEPCHDIRDWFTDHGFTEVAFTAPHNARFRVGMHRPDPRTEPPQPLRTGTPMFTFT
jgi:hypothetical protein